MVTIYRKSGRRKGFTLVELLVVVSIIALLIAILLPILRSVRDRADAVTCQNNLRSLMQAFTTFAGEHKGCLPGGKHDTAAVQPDADKRDWLTKDGVDMPVADRDITGGTIFRYVRNPKTYVCPSVAYAPIFGAGVGTNARFDYSVFNIWPVAQLDLIKAKSYYDWQGVKHWMPTPIIVQEQPESINKTNIEGGHSNTDKMAHVHSKGSYYATPDGGVTFVNEPDMGDRSCWNWHTQAPSGTYIEMGPDFRWGEFNGR